MSPWYVRLYDQGLDALTQVLETQVMPGNAYESSSGGPFNRDINTDRTSTNGAHNLYFYMVRETPFLWDPSESNYHSCE